MSGPSKKLATEEHQRIFRERVLPDAELERFTSHDRPRAVVLAGQPGSGKSRLESAAVSEFNADIVPIDPDAVRDLHPQAMRWQKESPYGWSQRTNSDAGAWAAELREAVVERRVNLLVDTTLGDVNNANRLVKGLQGSGYDVEIRVVAAHRLESEHGIDERFTRSMDANGVARDVPRDFQDKVYRDLPRNLDVLHEAG